MSYTINDLKNDLLILKDQISIFKHKNDFVKEDILEQFHDLYSKIDNLNNSLNITNTLKNNYSFFSISEVESFLKEHGFDKKMIKEVNEPFNLEIIDSVQTPEILRNIQFSQIQKEINKFKRIYNLNYVLFFPKKNIVKQVAVKDLEHLIDVVLKMF